jgi:hypothetical protein
MPTKKCNKCNEIKNLTDFRNKTYKVKSGESRVAYEHCCKACTYAKADKESLKKARLSHAQRNPNAAKEATARHRAKNLELCRKRDLRYYYENKEKYQKRNKDWYAKNPEKACSSTHRRRAKLKENGVFEISQKDLKRIYNSPCFYCGSNKNITLDHVIPIIKGGVHSIGNAISLCLSCNSSKRDKLLIEWLNIKQ